MKNETELAVIAELHKDKRGKLKLFSLVTSDANGTYGKTYDVDWCKRDGRYYYHMSGCGPLPNYVSGIYWCYSLAMVKEKPSTIINAASRKLNATRRLRRVPPSFMKSSYGGTRYTEIFDWLQNECIEDSTNCCSMCDDMIPDEGPCEHIWWCEKLALWSTPSDRYNCECEDCKP